MAPMFVRKNDLIFEDNSSWFSLHETYMNVANLKFVFEHNVCSVILDSGMLFFEGLFVVAS